MNKQIFNSSKWLFLLLFMFTVTCTFAQKMDEQVLDSAEVMPLFPGGNSKMMQYLRIPVSEATSIAGGVQQHPIIQFIVEKEGKITNAKIVRSVDSSIDEAALKLVEDMPAWIPGEQKGKKVRVRMSVPVFTVLKSSLKLEELERNKKDERTGGGSGERALLIIDNVDVGSDFRIDYINIENIKDFKVLRGEEAMDLYGEKGQNGVILIKLKSLKEMKGMTVGKKVAEMLKNKGVSKKTPIVYCLDEKQFPPEVSEIISKNEYNEKTDFIAIKEIKKGIAYITFKNNSSFYIR